MFLDHFDMLILKIILKNKKKIYFDIFLSEKTLNHYRYHKFQTHLKS
jgi:hypothetical protein